LDNCSKKKAVLEKRFKAQGDRLKKINLSLPCALRLPVVKIVLYNRPALSLNTLLKGSKKVRT